MAIPNETADDSPHNLWAAAVGQLDQGDYLNALWEFLKIELSGLVFVDRRSFAPSLKQIGAFDVDRDDKDELLLLKSDGHFVVDQLDPDSPCLYLHRDNTNALRLAFCTLSRDRVNGNPRFLVAEQTDYGSSKLREYRVDGHGRSFNIVTLFAFTVSDTPLEGVVAFQSKVFAATANKQILQYNELILRREGQPYSNPLSLRKLVTSVGSPYIVGIGREAGLCKYSIDSAGLTAKQFAGDRQFAGGVIADIRDIGLPDIVAFTRGGSIFVFDSETLDEIYRYRVPDEALDLCCFDIAPEGRVALLVGGAANRVYVLALNEARELAIIQTWDLPHRVKHLAPMHRDYGVGNEKALAIGLETDKVLIAAFPTHREISMRVNQALRGLRTKRYAWAKGLLQHPIVLTFALTTMTKDLRSEDIEKLLRIAERFLRRGQWETPLLLAVLPRLKTFLTRFLESSGLLEQVFKLLELVTNQAQNLVVCEAACSALNEIVREPGLGTERAQHLLLAAQRHRDLLMISRPRRQEHVQRLLSEENLDEANRQIEILAYQRLDLLQTLILPGPVWYLGYHADERQLVYITVDGNLGILDPDLQPVARSFSGVSAILCLASSPSGPTRYLVFKEMDAVILEGAEHKVVSQFAYSGPARTACLARDQGTPIWVVGTDDYIALGDQSGERDRIPVEHPIAAVLTLEGVAGTPIYAISVTGQVYQVIYESPASGARRSLRLDLAYDIGGNINVQDAARGGRDNLIVAGTREIVLLAGLAHRLWQQIAKIKIQGSPICVAPIPDPEQYGAWWVVGTREGGLHFFDSKLVEQRAIFRDHIPIVICCTPDQGSGCHVYVGCTGSNIRSFSLLSNEDIEKVRQLCDPRWQEKWQELCWEAQLALICLAAQGRDAKISLAEIYERLDSRIRSLTPVNSILNGLRTLVEAKLVRVEGDSLYYFAADAFRNWVAARHPDPFSVLRAFSEPIVERWSLTDLAQIQDAAVAAHTPQWVSETFGLDPEIWQRAVSLSRYRRALAADSPTSNEPRVLAYLHALGELVGCIAKSDVQPSGGKSFHCSLTVPGVAFQGFDHILTVFVAQHDLDGLSEAISELVRLGQSRVRIALIVTTESIDLIRSVLRESFFAIAVMDDGALKRVALSPRPKESFLDHLIGQIDIPSLSPFQIAGPVRDSFYGREVERSRIRGSLLRPGARSFAVIGPRRIGKTSLLLRVQDEIGATASFEPLYLDLSPYGEDIDQVLNRVMQRIGAESEGGGIAGFLDAVARRQSATRKRLVLLLDEVDAFLAADTHNGYRFFNTLRALVNEVGVKLVVAGYKVLYAEMSNGDSPLFNLLERVELGRLEAGAAHDLVAHSLAHVYAIDGSQINRILEKTGRYPNFIQFFCSLLIKRKAKQHDRIILPADIDGVLQDHGLYQHMVQVYLWNLDELTDAVLFLLVANYDPSRDAFVLSRDRLDESSKTPYAKKLHSKLCFSRQFTPYDLHRFLELHGFDLNPKELEDLISQLVLASILCAIPEGKEYTFTLLDLPLILKRHQEVEEIATSYVEKLDMLKTKWRLRTNRDVPK